MEDTRPSRIGRPRVDPARKRQQMWVYVTDEERERIKEAAKVTKVDASVFIREVTLRAAARACKRAV